MSTPRFCINYQYALADAIRERIDHEDNREKCSCILEGLIAQLLCGNNSPSACISVYFIYDDKIEKNVLSLENFLLITTRN